jgi:ADP-ribose pyrophosphatase YjhB (NUDIX family)
MPRISAKAIIIRDRRLLVVVHRDADGAWYSLPGGGQEPFETLPDALRRECLEEIDAVVEVGELLHVRDYIGRHHEFADADRDVHQVELMFAASVPGDYTPRIGAGADSNQVSTSWLPLDALATARLFPAALKAALVTGAPVYLGAVN